jgi:hypothetical protein
MCPGYGQESVEAVRVLTEYLYRDNGGDLPGVERSNADLRWADAGDAPCRSCSMPRELSEHPRPSYQPLSGYDPMGLLHGPAFDPNRVNSESDARMAAMEAEMVKLRQMLADALGEPD